MREGGREGGEAAAARRRRASTARERSHQKNHQRNSVHIKATRAGPAVLCTAAATYELKTVETTNALLLVPEGEVSFVLEGWCFKKNATCSCLLPGFDSPKARATADRFGIC